MSSECSHNCADCSQSCAERDAPAQDLKAPLHPRSSVKKVVAVLSGKGGVGKSLVAALTACAVRRRGHRVGVLDADLTGPSIPQAFGIHEQASGDEGVLYPAVSEGGVEVMSVNLLLDDAADPVVWRGPVVAGVVRQFWSDVLWENIDVLFIDMPPGTGDVPLTVFQSLPVDGILVVTSPQEMVSMIVEKAVRMAEMMHIPILGVIENMSYLTCPDCGRRISLFGEGKSERAAAQHGLPLLARLPIRPDIAAAIDAGEAERVDCPELAPAADAVEALLG